MYNSFYFKRSSLLIEMYEYCSKRILFIGISKYMLVVKLLISWLHLKSCLCISVARFHL